MPIQKVTTEPEVCDSLVYLPFHRGEILKQLKVKVTLTSRVNPTNPACFIRLIRLTKDYSFDL